MTTSRRAFLKATALCSAILSSCTKIKSNEEKSSRQNSFTAGDFTGEINTKKVYENEKMSSGCHAFGRVLALGSICLNGSGALQDFSIRNKPDTSALPDWTSFNRCGICIASYKGRE